MPGLTAGVASTLGAQISVLAYLTAAISCHRRRHAVASLLTETIYPLNCYRKSHKVMIGDR